MEDSFCHHDKFGCFKLKDKFKFSMKKTKKVVKGSQLTNLVDLELAVHICILIILGRGKRRLLMK